MAAHGIIIIIIKMRGMESTSYGYSGKEQYFRFAQG
jgi:hypothetical protein